jgi:hypothetical protein
MTSQPQRIFAPLTALATSLALAACGGATASQPAGPAPVVVAPPPGEAPATPKVTTPGPNVTPEGVIFNHRAEGKDRKIYLAGNFNEWNPADPSYLMKDDDGDGVWSITVKLAPGTYQYKYVIDDKWTQDPYAPGEAPDGFGGRNSQFEVK